MTAPPKAASTRGDLTIKEVADLWGRSRRTVRRAVASGRLPYRKVGHFTYFRREDAEALAPKPHQDRRAARLRLTPSSARPDRLRQRPGLGAHPEAQGVRREPPYGAAAD